MVAAKENDVDYEEIVYEVKNRIARVTLNRPEKLNRLTNKMMLELVHALENAKEDREVRVVVVDAAGHRAFCAGADLSEFEGLSAVQSRDKNDLYCRLCKAFPALGKPCIAAVDGLALAGGCGLAIATDITIASTNARFGVPEIKVGLWSMMVSAMLRRTVGRKRALELLLSGDVIDAREAERIGLINKVVPREELEETVERLARDLAEKSPVILKFGRDAFYSTEDMEFSKALDYLREMAALLAVTTDSQEGIAAFLEKRTRGSESE